VITRDLRRAIARAVAAAGYRQGGDPGLRPTGTPGQYAASIALTLGGNPREVAGTLTAALAQEPWIAVAEVTGPGYLTVTVTPQALTAVADTITRAGPGCVTSDALAGQVVPAAPPGDPLAAATWDEARSALAARLTARLAAAAGATVTDLPDAERIRVPPPDSTGDGAGGSRTRYADSGAESGANPQVSANLPVAALEPPPGMSGAPRHDIPGNFTTSGNRSAPMAAEERPDTDVARAVAFAGRDAVLFTLARAIPGKPLPVAPETIARHVLGNPAYAVRYAHARAASGVRWAVASSAADTIGAAEASALLDALSWLPERVATAARRGRPDEFARYLEDLASATVDVLSSAGYPGKGPRIGTAPGSDRLTLAKAARTGLAAGLGLLEVTAPERLLAEICVRGANREPCRPPGWAASWGRAARRPPADAAR
jgi:arginyl-tRNA synthetase